MEEKDSNKKYKATVDDAAGKVHLLKAELAFNEALAQTLEQTRSISRTLDNAQAEADKDNMIAAIGKLEEAVDAAKDFSRFENTQFTTLLHERIAQLGSGLLEKSVEFWETLVVTEAPNRRVVIHQSTACTS